MSTIEESCFLTQLNDEQQKTRSAERVKIIYNVHQMYLMRGFYLRPL